MKLSMALQGLLQATLLAQVATGFSIRPSAGAVTTRLAIPLIGHHHYAQYSRTICSRRFVASISNEEDLGFSSQDESSIPNESSLTDGDIAATKLMEWVKMVDQTHVGELAEDIVIKARNAMMECSTTMQGEQGALLVEKLLFRIISEWDEATRAGDLERAKAWQPQTEDFVQAMTAWEQGSSTLETSCQRVGSIFFELEDLFLSTRLDSVQPDEQVFRMVLRALSFSRERGADRRAWAILERVKTKYGLEPDADMYGSVIRSLAKSKQRDAAERAEELLRDAVAQFPPGTDEHGKATGVSVENFNVVLTAWAKSGFEDGPQRAEELLVFMDGVHRSNENSRLTPDVKSFTSLIDAYAQTNEWDGVNQSEQILNRLLSQFLEGETEIEPNVASWTIAISAWTRLSRKGFKGAAQKADRLLRRMEELHQGGKTTVAPDAITYVTVLNAWAACKTPDGPQRAEEILNEMNERYLDGEVAMKPSTKSLRMLIDAYIKTETPTAMKQAESLLERYEDMEEFKEPIEDEIVKDIYKSMLFGWSKHGDPYRAEGYLRDMVEMGMNPDSFCYDRIIEAYTHKGLKDSMRRSYAVFELMDSCRKSGDVKPNERVYTSFIRALTKGKVKELPKKAALILKRMDELHSAGNKGIKPTTFTYNAVLNACAESIHTEDPNPLEAFKVAISVFNNLRMGKEEPDHVTFGNMLRCAALLPEGDQRNAVVTTTFELCCERGFVNSYVVRDLQLAAPEQLWRSLLQWPEGDVETERLPASWRNKFERKAKPEKPMGRKFSKKY